MAVAGQPAHLTYADYAALPDDGRRWELIDGELFLSPSPKTRHQDVLLRLARHFANHVAEHGGGRVFIAPYDAVLADDAVLQPDLLFVSDADSHRITEANLQGPPTLAAEVVSDPRHDLVRKRELYARFGVREYWAVLPDADRIEVFRLPAGAERAYPKPTLFEPGDHLSTDLVPGLVIDIAELLAR